MGRIVCIGDSLTEGDYGVYGKSGIANVQEKGYPYFLSKLTGKEVINCGKCGFRASTYLEYYKAGNVKLEDAEIILMMLGTNGGMKGGNALDSESTSEDKSIVSLSEENASYAELIDLVEKDAPEAKIILITPPHATKDPSKSNCGYADQIKEAVVATRELAEEKKLDLIDLASCEEFTAENENVMQPNDGLHYGEVGYEIMAKYIFEHADCLAYPYSVRDVWISDPFIFPDPVSKLYYTYVQFVDPKRFPELVCEEPVFYCLKSKDLIHWSRPEVCFRQGDFWASRDYWAPELHMWKGKYYLISSFRAPGTYRMCQCLVAYSPAGPFKPHGEPLTPEGWHCLDGHLYVDGDEKPWLVFCHEWLQVGDGQMCLVPLSDDLTKAIGKPEILFRASDAPWRRKVLEKGGQGYVTDGPYVYKMKNGSLLMLWSNFDDNGAYCVGYATSRFGNIHGPWVQHADPIYYLDGGHAMLFHTFEGQLMMACHSPNDHVKKRILLFEMEEKEDKLAIINEVTGNWYNEAGGIAKGWCYKEKLLVEPTFTKLD